MGLVIDGSARLGARSETRKTIDSATSDGSTSRPSALISTGEIA